MQAFMWVDDKQKFPSLTARQLLDELNKLVDDSGETGLDFVFPKSELGQPSFIALVRFDSATGYGEYGLYDEVVEVWEWPCYPELDATERRRQTAADVEMHLRKMLVKARQEQMRSRAQWLFKMSVARVQAERERRSLPIGGSTSTSWIRLMRQFDAMKAEAEAKTATIEAQIRSERDALDESSRVAAEMAKQRRQYAAANPGGAL